MLLALTGESHSIWHYTRGNVQQALLNIHFMLLWQIYIQKQISNSAYLQGVYPGERGNTSALKTLQKHPEPLPKHNAQRPMVGDLKSYIMQYCLEWKLITIGQCLVWLASAQYR